MRPKLSGYRVMWMLVMFDLPVGTKSERKAATHFRQSLLDLGFEMAQFSIYYRIMGSKDIARRYMAQIEREVPCDGSVNILSITDKQYGNMVCFTGQQKKEPPRVEQLTLF